MKEDNAIVPIRPKNAELEPQERTEEYDPEMADIADYPHADDVEGYKFEKESDLPDPIAVYLTDDVRLARDYKTWNSTRLTVVDSRPTQLAGRSERRTRLFIRNTHATNAVFLTNNSSTPVGFGFELAAGADIELFHYDDVWAQCDSGDTSTVSIATEYLKDAE